MEIRMKVAVIGASQEALHTIEKAQEYGLTVMALDGDPHAVGLRASDLAKVVDISDENAVIEALKRETPDFVLTAPIGRYLTTIGAVNDAFGLPGISKKTAVLCTDKLAFHQRLASGGLRNCCCYAVSGGEKKEFKITFPAILKPRYGSGSRGIHVAMNREELEQALKALEGEAYVLEECVAGEEYGVDGAVTRDGFQMILLRRKENTPLPARQAVGYFSVLPSEEFWRQVQEYMVRIVESLGLEECLLHADLIRGKEGPFVIELSARPSGHNLHNLFTPLCTGVDMAEEYIKYRMGLACEFMPKYTRTMMIHYFDMEGRVRKIPDRNSVEQAAGGGLAAWDCRIREGEYLEPVSDGHSLMGRGYFILEGKEASALRAAGQHIKDLFFNEK